MTGRTRHELADHEWRMTRAEAEQVTCPECHAAPGQPCTNLTDGQPLGRLPAHWRRIHTADKDTHHG